MLKKNQMMEFYVFINPIEKISLENIKNILTFIKTRTEKVDLHILPLLNLNSFNYYMKKNHLPGNDLDARNHLFSQTYDLCLSYIAASMQGKKKGRKFLVALLEAILEDERTYSEDLILTIAEQVKLDIPMFEEDKVSDFVQTTFKSDQKVARDMKVTSVPTTVMYNENIYDYGLLLEEEVSFSLLNNLSTISPNHLDAVIENNTVPNLRVLN